MRRRVPVAVMSFVVVMSGPVVAQQKPDFSGTWVPLDNPQSQLQITHDGSHLTLAEAGTRLTFYLDGSDSRNTNMGPNGEVWLHVSQATWISSAVVITTRTSSETLPNWNPFTMLTTYSLEPQTGNLSVTTLSPLKPRGYERFMATTTRMYKKSG